MSSTIGLKNLQLALAQALIPSAYQGVVGAGSTTTAVVDAIGGFSTDQWDNYGIQFNQDTTTAALRGVWQKIDSNTGTTLAMTGALPALPVAGDTYVIRAFGSQQQNVAQIGGTAQTGADWTPHIQGIGTDATGVVPPAGATGIRGWLSSLYNLFILGTAKAVMRGGAKGATAAADVTSSSVDANTQAMHVAVPDGSDVAQGAKADLPATSADATPWTVVSLLKGLLAKLLSSINVTVLGSLPAFAAIPAVKVDQTTPGTTNAVAIDQTTQGTTNGVVVTDRDVLVETLTWAEALEIRDTGSHYLPGNTSGYSTTVRADVRAFAQKSFVLVNTLNQALSVVIVHGDIVQTGVANTNFQPVPSESLAAGARKWYGPNGYPMLGEPFSYMTVQVACAVLPTSGSVTIKFQGGLR